MSKASEIRAAFNEGYQAGIVDTVGQDKARLGLATALVIAEVANIIRGGAHKCSEAGIGMAEDMPHANGRCYSCALVSFVGDASVSEYQRISTNIAAMNDNAGPTE